MNKQEKIEARRKYDREWKKAQRLKNPEKVREQARMKYRKMRENPEKVSEYKKYHNEYNKKYCQKEEWKEYRRNWMREWNRKNQKKIYQQRRARPYEKLAASIRSRIHDCVKFEYKSKHTEELLGISIKELKKYLERMFKEGMTWENYGQWHIDHIIPLSSFDLTKTEEQEKAFHYTNLQPLWAKENLQKHAKILIK